MLPKITFYVSPELWKQLYDGAKTKGYSSIGSYCKFLPCKGMIIKTEILITSKSNEANFLINKKNTE